MIEIAAWILLIACTAWALYQIQAIKNAGDKYDAEDGE